MRVVKAESVSVTISFLEIVSLPGRGRTRPGRYRFLLFVASFSIAKDLFPLDLSILLFPTFFGKIHSVPCYERLAKLFFIDRCYIFNL